MSPLLVETILCYTKQKVHQTNCLDTLNINFVGKIIEKQREIDEKDRGMRRGEMGKIRQCEEENGERM